MKKRLLSLFLTIVMVVGLLPATALPVAAADSGSSGGGVSYDGSFGIVTDGDHVLEGNDLIEAKGQAPYGPITDNPNQVFTVFERPELFLGYGYDGHKNLPLNLRVYDYNGAKGTDTGKLTSNFTKFDNDQVSVKKSYNMYTVFADSAAVDVGEGEGANHIVMTTVNSAWEQWLTMFDEKGNKLSNEINMGKAGWMDLKAYEGGGFMSVTAGDYDGDGQDEVAVYDLNDGRIDLYEVNKYGIIPSEPTKVMDIGEMQGNTRGSGSARDHAQVDMVTDDTDRDGLDELVITVSPNDHKDGNNELGVKVYIYDWKDGKTKTEALSYNFNGDTSQAKKGQTFE